MMATQSREAMAYLIQGALTRMTWPLTGYISASLNSLAAPRPEQFTTIPYPASSCGHSAQLTLHGPVKQTQKPEHVSVRCWHHRCPCSW